MNLVKLLLLVFIGLLQYRLWFGDGNILEFQRLNDRIAELRQEGERRRERNAALEAEVVDLKQGLDAVEERARQDLGMIKEGEVFVQVIDESHRESEASPAPSTETQTPTPARNDVEKKAKPEKSSKSANREPGQTAGGQPKAAAANKPVPPKARPSGVQKTLPGKPQSKPRPLVETPRTGSPTPDVPADGADQ